MRSNDPDLAFRNRRYTDNFFKMTKVRTITFLMMVVASCALIASLTDAYPTTKLPNEGNSSQEDIDSGNNTRLVITHVVKTIEFEVGVLEDDGIEDESNTTESDTEQYIETDIKLLNVDLLKEILDKASENESTSTKSPEVTTESQNEDSKE